MTQTTTAEYLAALELEAHQEVLEYEEMIADHRWVVDQHVALLAWLHRQMKSPFPLSDHSHWPGVWPMDWADFIDMVTLDPLIFDLARHQAAADLRCEPDRPLNIMQEANLFAHAATLLEAERPSQKSLPLGRIGVKGLTKRIRVLVEEENHWGLRRTERSSDDPWMGARLSETAFSEALHDQLNKHPVLATFPDAVPQPEAIRDIFRDPRRKKRVKKVG